jgi:TRAP-type C4-dicarboxylate transport system substrate-binding protein
MNAKAFAAAATIVAAAVSSAGAEPVSLKFATLNPPNAHLNVQFIRPWVARINAEGKDALRIEQFDGLTIANNLNVFDRVHDDVEQIAFGLPIYVSGKYPLTDVTTLPFVAEKSESASVAFWRLYESGAFGAEYADLRPLITLTLPQQGVHLTKKPVKSLDDLRGVKMRAASKITAQLATSFGATPISINVGEMFEALQRGTIEATFMPWTAFQPFKLAEVTYYHVDVPLGGAPALIFMARKKYDSLPAAARRAIDANSGEKPTREFGKFWDATQTSARAQVADLKGQTIVTLSTQKFEPWRQRAQAVVDQWAAETPGGAKVLAAFRAEIARAGTAT